MQPTKLNLNNFLSYGNTEIDFQGLRLVALLGHNGSGKSSLVDGITFSLYGEGRYKDIDRYIRQGQEQAIGELQFALADEVYRVIRTRSNRGKGKSTLELAKQGCSGWISLSGATMKETQDKIRDLLRMDYETFVSSCVILQDEADRLTKATPGKRMEIFGQILGLDIYDQLQETAKAKARGYRDQAAIKRAAIDNIDADLSRYGELKQQEQHLDGEQKALRERINQLEIDLENQEKIVSDLRVKAARSEDLRGRQTKINSELASNDSRLSGLEQKRERLQKIIDRGDEIRTKAKELEQDKKQIAACDDKATRERQLSRDCETLERQVAKFDREQESEICSIKSSLESKRRQAELLEKVPCSGNEKESCQLLKSAREAAAEIPVLDSRLKELREQKNPHVSAWQKACTARDAVKYDEAEHRRLRERVSALEKWTAVLPELNQAEENMAGIEQQADELQERQKELRAELVSINIGLADIEKVAAELRKTESIFFGTRQQLKEIQELDQDTGIKLGTVSSRLKDLDAKAGQKVVLENELKVFAQEEHLYAQLTKAFGRAGIPALIIENALPEVEILANDLLSRLTGGRMEIRFETQKEAKTTGNISETLDIVVSDELGERPYEGWSGAEKFETDLAIRLAISKFLARRAGAKIELLVCDEGASCLDQQGRTAFTEAINIIAEDFSIVIVVTHIDELKEAFPQQIVVRKTVEGSKVEVAL